MSSISKTALKAHSAHLQELGEQMLRLSGQRRDALALPASLTDALDALARIRAHGGRRRQKLYVGKLLRKLDDEQIAAIKQALHEEQHGAAADVVRLHALEDWRERLLASDDAVTQWMDAYPQTDAQQLRALLRQVRKDRAQDTARNTNTTAATQPPGAPRKTRSWRLLYQFLGEHYDRRRRERQQSDAAPAPS